MDTKIYGYEMKKPSLDEVYHHGVKGMKWGVRKYQNDDGSYTKAGRKRYGIDLDVNDKSRKNVAKIRLGEAKRRYDVARSKNNGNHVRNAELRTRVRSAKKAVRTSKRIDKGAKLYSKGQTIEGNVARSHLGYAGAAAGTAAVALLASKRLSTLGKSGLSGQRLRNAGLAANIITRASALTLGALATGYAAKKMKDNVNIRAYQRAKSNNAATYKQIGSQEYQDVLKRRGKS